MYQTNAIDLFSALYQITYENENDINQIVIIEEIEAIEQIATFERKSIFKCKLNPNNILTQKRIYINVQISTFPFNIRTN